MTLWTPNGTAQRILPASEVFTCVPPQPHTSPTIPQTLSLPRNTPPLRFGLPNLWIKLSIYPLVYFLILIGPALHLHHRWFPDSPSITSLHLIHPGFTRRLVQMGPRGHPMWVMLTSKHWGPCFHDFPRDNSQSQSLVTLFNVSHLVGKLQKNVLIGSTRKI